MISETSRMIANTAKLFAFDTSLSGFSIVVVVVVVASIDFVVVTFVVSLLLVVASSDVAPTVVVVESAFCDVVIIVGVGVSFVTFGVGKGVIRCVVVVVTMSVFEKN